MDKYKPLYFRPSNIVKAYSIISSNSDSDTILEQRNNTLDWAMNTLINNATALYSIIIAEVERKTGESLDINKHHVEIVDQIAKQFYANTPTVMQYFTDDAVLIEAWTVLCSDIGCNYNI